MSMWLRLVPAALVVAAALEAQSAGVLDDATFTLTRAGAPFGTESYKIVRRLGAEGMEYVAQSERTIDGRIVRSSLTIDSAGSAVVYTKSVTGSGAGQLTARRAMNRLTVNEEGARASSRDYAYASGTVLLDDDVINPLFFVTWREPRDVAFVDLSGRATGRGALSEAGRENLRIGNATIRATRYTFGEGSAKREIWIDSERRLLKIAHPAKQVVAVRDSPPRE